MKQNYVTVTLCVVRGSTTDCAMIDCIVVDLNVLLILIKCVYLLPITDIL